MFKTILVIIGIIIFLVLFHIIFNKAVILSDSQKEYIGHWKGDGITLIIDKDSMIQYSKEKGNSSSSVSGPIVSFGDKSFKTGISVIRSTFVIDKGPYLDGKDMKMVIDGNELIKDINNGKLVVPSIEELNNINNNLLTLFSESSKNDDFKSLYNDISEIWKSQFSEEDFAKTFAAFKNEDIDIKEYIKSEIIYTKPPYISEHDSLVTQGYYTSNPKLYFTLTYIYEHPRWKSAGINISVR